jgi:nitrogen fixation protein NifQ
MVTEVEKLLVSYAKDDLAKERASVVAQKSIKLNHLYTDMGFENRSEMHQFMTQNFPDLADRKPQDIRWKKYLYDQIGEIAPACAYCDDATNCLKCELRIVNG